MTKPAVVIVGGGFAGLAAAQRLSARHAVTLLDRTPDFEFLPNLHELVSRIKKPRSLRHSRARLLGRWGHTFIEDEAAEIDPQHRRVRTRRGTELRYDALIVATGSAVSRYDVPGAREHAFPLRSVDAGVAIGRRLQALAGAGGSKSVTIVGGGFTGVECLGEILRRYRRARRLTVQVVEPSGRLLAACPKAVHRALRDVTRDFAVDLLTRESVAAVEPHAVLLGSGGRLHSDLTLWTTGGAPAPLLSQAGLAAPGRWADARPTLQSRAYDDVFIAGDSAQLEPAAARQSYQARAMGRRAARNVERLLSGRPLRDYSPPDEQLLVTFGYLSGFYIDDDVIVEGAALCLARELLFQLGMAEFERPSRAGARRRLLRRLRGSARLRAWPAALRALLPPPYARQPRDRFDLPSLPRVLEWRGRGRLPIGRNVQALGKAVQRALPFEPRSRR